MILDELQLQQVPQVQSVYILRGDRPSSNSPCRYPVQETLRVNTPGMQGFEEAQEVTKQPEEQWTEQPEEQTVEQPEEKLEE